MHMYFKHRSSMWIYFVQMYMYVKFSVNMQPPPPHAAMYIHFIQKPTCGRAKKIL